MGEEKYDIDERWEVTEMLITGTTRRVDGGWTAAGGLVIMIL
ncbi:hypothetical protein HJC23_010948 [Cyclotella cryptica]|uniref:Uncharacterized protein n=1 Tax=Cyclotella cryptica TaxID=29204 RepID=A0ABD3QAQ6_9STRA